MPRVVRLGDVEEYIISDARHPPLKRNMKAFGARVLKSRYFIILEVDMKFSSADRLRTWFGFIVSTLLTPEAGFIFKGTTLRMYAYFTLPTYRLNALCKLFVERAKPARAGLACLGGWRAIDKIAAVASPPPNILITPYEPRNCKSKPEKVDLTETYNIKDCHAPWRQHHFYICHDYEPPTPRYNLKTTEETGKIHPLSKRRPRTKRENTTNQS